MKVVLSIKCFAIISFFSLVSAGCNARRVDQQVQKHAINSGQGASDIGQGAVFSQAEINPWRQSHVDSCSASSNLPSEQIEFADATNYGNRDVHDFQGRIISSRPRFVVIHETVIGERDTLALFKTKHPYDADQASYHLLVARDGRLIRIVPDGNRAYGAGMSQFLSSTLRAKRNSAGSLNNIALHISLVSPSGFEDDDSHIGYTEAQYRSLAAQVLKWQMMYGIPMSRVTTHYAVDRSHSRYDPRSFYWDKFDKIHGQLTVLCGNLQLAQPTQ